MIAAGLREKVGRWILRRKTLRRADGGYRGWSAVKNIHFLASLNDPWRLSEWTDLQQRIEGMGLDVHILMYDPEFNEPLENSWSSLQKWGTNQLNFWGLPKKQFLTLSKDMPTDLLIDWTSERSLAQDFLFSQWNARFRIGHSLDAHNDFMVLNDPDRALSDRFDTLVDYLQKINSPQK